MQPKLIITFERLSASAFDIKTDLINNALKSNVNFPQPWPAYVPQLADIGTSQANYHPLFEAVERGDLTQIPARDAARQALTTQLKKLAPYLELVADGDIGKLQTTGYDLRHDIVQSNNNSPLPLPPDFSFTRGEVSGTMVASATALADAGSYELNTCTGDPAVEANWIDQGTFRHCSNIVTGGYKPGTVYYARLRGVGSNGGGVWAVSPGVMAV